jgi:hypothetical protein
MEGGEGVRTFEEIPADMLLRLRHFTVAVDWHAGESFCRRWDGQVV